jgi:hypothetical protein
MSDAPETDAAWDKYTSPPYTYGAGDLRILAQRLERERDEARAVAGELANVASKYLSFLLAVTPSKANETHEKETMKVIAALKRWKEL